MKRGLVLYPLIIILFTGMIWLVIDKGQYMTPKKHQANGVISGIHSPLEFNHPEILKSNETVTDLFVNNIKSPFGLFLLQIVVILVVSRIFGVVLTKIGQPSVVGEIIAGIFLGPSIAGYLFPDFAAFVFPAASLKNLQFLSQMGLVLFMFIIGMELDIEQLKKKSYKAVIISHASIIFPFFLGVSVSYFIYRDYAPDSVSFIAFSLFMGIAMSITAFPVLARIVQERGLSKTPLGTMVIACAAADDVTAWCILAFVIAIVKAGSIISALITVVLSVIFITVMIGLVRPWFRKIYLRHMDSGKLNKSIVFIAFFILLISAYTSEIIGIHALFGAFLAGFIIPTNTKFRELLTEKVEDISVLLILPIFFALTGLRTQIGLLNESHMWGTCGLIIFVAVLGKFAGSAGAARMVGNTWKDSLSIGALMNTRGLMELIVLNIGYDLGILSPEIFAIMVLMALSTTFMTGPLLDLIAYFDKKKNPGSIS